MSRISLLRMGLRPGKFYAEAAGACRGPAPLPVRAADEERMTRERVGRAWLVALTLAGCVSYEQAVENTRADLIGLSGGDLRRCLGVPTDFDREDGAEYMTYRWVFKPKEPLGMSTAVGSGGIGGIVIGRRDAGGGYDPLGFPRDASEQSTCQIVFRLERGAVVRVTANGESETGLETDAKCLMRARHCSDVDSDDEAED